MAGTAEPPRRELDCEGDAVVSGSAGALPLEGGPFEQRRGGAAASVWGSHKMRKGYATRAHTMRFGAEVRSNGTAFRLWAPAAATIELVLDCAGVRSNVALSRCDGGWFERVVAGVGAGARYAFRIDGGTIVPDPASRANPDGVHAPSIVVDPRAHQWRDEAWRGRPWHEAVIYELHVGCATSDGTFAAAIERLDDLVDLGVTAVELMPVAAFAGTRNWGYDGVLPFAPAAAYGTPEDLKRLIDEAHARGLMMLLDVVYNHFGPEGNYLHLYAPRFFNPRHPTPWGAAIDFEGDSSATVRQFFIENALYWLEEFHFDGLRLDAVHAIIDTSPMHIVMELAKRVRQRFGDTRLIHLVLENDRNEARYLARDAAARPLAATAQWNDDVHHALHVIATGEKDGYYGDYVDRPFERLARALAEGFAFQGEPSPYRHGARRGECSSALPATAFVSFAQNHDQVGNRAFGERITALAGAQTLRALVTCMLLAPQTPLLFMGEEFAASSPFLFFCDFGPDLARDVTRGRREEFARFARFRDRSEREAIPDPNAWSTFIASKVDWREAAKLPGMEWRAFYRRLLTLRRRFIAPFAATLARGGAFRVDAPALVRVDWSNERAARLHLVANLCADAHSAVALPAGELVYGSEDLPRPGTSGTIPAYGVAFIIARA